MERSYWKTDRVIDAKLDKFQIALEDNKDDNGSEYSKREKMNRRFIQVVFQFILFS